jgi:hypothetical protein
MIFLLFFFSWTNSFEYSLLKLCCEQQKNQSSAPGKQMQSQAFYHEGLRIRRGEKGNHIHTSTNYRYNCPVKLAHDLIKALISTMKA